jgi:hypothetical protein
MNLCVNNPGNATPNERDQSNTVIAVKPNGIQVFAGYYDRSADFRSKHPRILAVAPSSSVDQFMRFNRRSEDSNKTVPTTGSKGEVVTTTVRQAMQRLRTLRHR